VQFNFEIVNCTINRTGTDGHRPIGRTWHVSRYFLGRGDLLAYQEHSATSSPQDDPFTSALDDPILVSLPDCPQAVPDPRWKIQPSAWAIVLQRVEQGEPLRHIARDYGVSYEAVRRVLRAARRC